MAKPKIKGANTKESFHCQLEAYQNSSHQCMHDKIEKIKALLQLRYFALIGDIMIKKNEFVPWIGFYCKLSAATEFRSKVLIL